MQMLKKIKVGFLALAGFGFILGSCAKVMPLTGGDEDKVPPAYRNSNPDTFSLNFKGKTITIRFDEYINLVDPTREILISPPVFPPPEYILSGQAVKIKFKDSLLSNITYVIQFGKSIQDITESNINTGFSFVFSTGSFLDSGEVRGNIVDAFTGKPGEGYKVMLYKTEVTDSFPYKEKPFYLAYTDGGGNFKLSNLRQGDYKIFALHEDNNNNIYDRSGEGIAFSTMTVSTVNDSTITNLVSFIEPGGKIKFNKAKSVSPIRTEFYFSGLADSVKVLPNFGIKDSGYFAYEFNKGKDTLTLWHEKIEADSFGVFLRHLNTIDTVVLRTNKNVGQPSGGKGRLSRASTGFAVVLDAAANMKFDLYSMPSLTFGEPIKNIDTSLFKILADSIPINYRIIADTTLPRKYFIDFERSSKKKYTIISDSAAFISISGKSTSQSTYTIGFREATEYGSVKIIYEDSIIKFPKIWHLLKDDKVIRETFANANQNDVQFSRIEPGSYRLRLILDENGNRMWDTGKYMEGKQPEKVLYMSEPIELKSGWDSEVIWKLLKKGRRSK